MTTTDARGKTLRKGDTVHKSCHRRTVSKGEVNGRVLKPMKTFTVRHIEDDVVFLRDTGKLKHMVSGNDLVKE